VIFTVAVLMGGHMHSISLAVLLCGLTLGAGVGAHEVPVDVCAVDAALGCAVEANLAGFSLMDVAAVVTGQATLKLLGTDAAGQVVMLDVSLADGSVGGRQAFEAQVEAPGFTQGLIAPDGGIVAMSLSDGGEEAGLQFFAASGQRLGLVSAEPPEGWGFEMSPAATLALLADQGVLTLDGDRLSGSFYRFEVSAAVADGVMTVRELAPATGAYDTLEAYLQRRFAAQLDGVGYEDVHVNGALSAVTTEASDGNPSRLMVRFEAGGEVAFDQRLGPERMGYSYSDARLSPDAAQVAVLRDASYAPGQPPVQLMVFDVATTAPVFVAPLPEGAAQQQVVWLPGNRLAVVQGGDGDADIYIFNLPAAE
jgi:hypothetical protein